MKSLILGPLAAFFLSLMFTLSSQAATTCKDLKSCAEVVYELTGQRYVWSDAAEKEKLRMSPDTEITKANAELVFSALLDQVHLARLPVGDGKTFRILPSAERKEHEMPILDGSSGKEPNWPKTWDWVSLRYKVKWAPMAEGIEMKYRLHVPREARLQADTAAGLLIVSGATPVVRQMFQTIQAADVEMTPAIKKELEENKRRADEWRKEQSKK